MPDLPHALDRSVLIRATRATVFAFFTDSARFARWWGAGSRIDPHPGGQVLIRYPEGTEARGEVLECVEGERVVFTYGYASGTPITPGASVVTITLSDEPAGTRVRLHHAFAEQAVCDQHVQGWGYQLALFANVAASDQHAAVEPLLDGYFAAWNTADGAARREALCRVVADGVTFHDAYGCAAGVDELAAHITAARQHMSGLTLARDGAVRQCQGTALAGWTATAADGSVKARGTSVVELSAEGRIARLTGFWG